ncbi:MAG: endonuclease domain-containing protein [Pyrinomonadaceae bacterium MAG19_C2-C3]|nr:endonuclease domain-containing protein [Pyrinomonadaceae bacterium MAG19_C2-C3]
MSEAFTACGLRAHAQFTIGAYITDFAFIEARLVVECDGSYWHGRPSQQSKDRQKDGYLKSQGWRVVRLGEDEINASPANCVDRVRGYLTDNIPQGTLITDNTPSRINPLSN